MHKSPVVAATFPLVAWLYTTACMGILCKPATLLERAPERTRGKLAVLERIAGRSEMAYINATAKKKEAVDQEVRTNADPFSTEGENLTEGPEDDLGRDSDRQLNTRVGQLLGHVRDAIGSPNLGFTTSGQLDIQIGSGGKEEETEGAPQTLH